jgi:PAS domain S-box-containing protein
MEKMIGYGRDELLGRTSIELGIWVDPEDRDRLLCALAEQGSVRDWECRFRAKGGHVLVARYFVELMELGGELCLLSLFVDETEKKRTLEELRRSEHEFRAMFDLSGVGMAQADPVTGQFVRVNRKFCEILGYSERELLGMTYAEITHPEDRESSIRSVQAVTKGEAGTWFVEKRYVRKGGEAIWVTAHGTALRDAEGRPIRAMAVVQDITERKLAEVALRESRQMLQAVLDTIPVRVFWKDRNSVFLGCNRLFAQDADLASPADIVGKVDGDLPWKAQAQSYVADDQAVMKTGQAKLNYEEAQTTAEGKQTWLRTSKIPMKDADGHSIGVLATYEDVTERKQAEEEIRRLNAELEQRVVDRTSELAAARARLEHLLTGTPAVIYSCDASGHFAATYVSPNVKVLLGYDASEYTTDWRFWSDHLHPDDAPGVLAMIPQLMQQGSLVCEYRFRHKDGTYRWMRDELRLAYGGAASARQIFGCWIDITARKEAEERLLTANATLERRGAELRALAAKLTQAEQQERRRVAHVLHEELQQILVVAKLAIGVIRPAVSGELLEAAVRSSGAIDQAIQVSRSLTTQLRPPVLYELGVVAALNWLARQMKEKYGLEVEVVARAEAEPASDDIRIFVFEAARELLFNVVKHAGVKDARLEIARQNGHVRLTVADDGAGFDPAKSGSSAESPGGYGLFSIRERAEALGGELTVDSAPGRGAVVTVLAPMQ